MRVSAQATLSGTREWFLWTDGRTYASPGAESLIASALPAGSELRTALGDPDAAEAAFRAAFSRLHADPVITRDTP